MAKIKDPPITLAPSYQVPFVRVSQKGVAKAPPPRVIPSGKRILAQAYGEMGQAIGDVAKYTAMREIATRDNVDSVEASDRIADLKNDLNQHYINNIAPLRGGKAKDIFKHEIETMAGMKKVFLKEVEENKRLHDALSIEFDKVTQDHLQKVFKHKLTQDANYARDTALKVAKTLQSEMSILTLDQSGKAIDISNQLNEQLAEYPELREAAKITAWKGMFKFNARVDPDLAQVAYENKTMRKSIVSQIGSEGYSVIQEAIDKGRAIGIQDNALAKSYAKEVEDERIELVMDEALHLYRTDPDKFTAIYIDTLKIPTPDQRILMSYLKSATEKKLSDVEVDWPTYDALLEDVRLVKLTKGNALDVRRNIIENMNKQITIEQGQSLLKALSNRDIFDNLVVQDTLAALKEMYLQGKLEPEQYSTIIRGVMDTAIKYDGDPKKIQEYMQDIVDPSVRKSAWSKYWEEAFPKLFTPTPEFKYVQPGVQVYVSDQEKLDIDTILTNQPTKDGVILTTETLSDDRLQTYIEYVRSPQFIKDIESIKRK